MPNPIAQPPPLAAQNLPIPLNPSAPLNTSQPSANPLVNAGIGLGAAGAVNVATSAAAGADVSLIAGALNVFLEWAKNRRRFPEQHTVLIMIVLSIVIAAVIWHFTGGEIIEAVKRACGVIVNAHTNYQSAQVSGVGLLKPTAPENRRAGVSLEAAQLLEGVNT